MTRYDLQVNDLSSSLHVVPLEALSTFGTTDTLHWAELVLATDSNRSDTALVLEQFGSDCAC